MTKVKRRYLKKTLTFFLGLIVVATIVFLGILFYVDLKLAENPRKSGYDSCFKVWATRGLVAKGNILPKSGNSIETIQRAFDSGARGTEVDLFYDPALKRYIISHDRPYNLKNGRLLTLEELLSATGDDHYFWLDLKKLGRLSKSEMKDAVSRLNDITGNTNIKSKLYIEGEDPINLGYFRDSGFKTIFDIRPLPENYRTNYFVVNLYKMFYYFNNFTVMAMKYGEIETPIFGVETQELLKHVPLFIYHVPDDKELIQDLSNLEQVNVIIEQDHSINRYQLTNCGNN